MSRDRWDSLHEIIVKGIAFVIIEILLPDPDGKSLLSLMSMISKFSGILYVVSFFEEEMRFSNMMKIIMQRLRDAMNFET